MPACGHAAFGVLHDRHGGEHVDLGRHAKQHRQVELPERVGMGVDQARQQCAPGPLDDAGARRSRPAKIRINDARIIEQHRAPFVHGLAVEDAHVLDQGGGARRQAGEGQTGSGKCRFCDDGGHGFLTGWCETSMAIAPVCRQTHLPSLSDDNCHMRPRSRYI
jgi:hypothetical protein